MIRYKRIDEETLQALVLLGELGLSARLVWCVNDEVGGGDGWRVGEVGVLDGSELTWGWPSMTAAENAFNPSATHLHLPTTNGNSLNTPDKDEEDDDDYWAQYDKTPGPTPTPKEPLAPRLGKPLEL